MGHEQEAALSSAERQANQLKLQQQQGWHLNRDTEQEKQYDSFLLSP